MNDERTDEELKAEVNCYGEMWDPEDKECINCTLQPRCLHALATVMLGKYAAKLKLPIEDVAVEKFVEMAESNTKSIEYALRFRVNPKIGLPIIEEDGAFRPQLQIVEKTVSSEEESQEAPVIDVTPSSPAAEESPHSTHRSKIRSSTKKTKKKKAGKKKAGKKKTTKKSGKKKTKKKVTEGKDLEAALQASIKPESDQTPTETPPKAVATQVASSIGYVVNASTGEVERANWGAFPPLMSTGDGPPIYQMAFWCTPLNGWVYLVARHTGRELGEGVYEMVPEEWRHVADRMALGLSPQDALKALLSDPVQQARSG